MFLALLFSLFTSTASAADVGRSVAETPSLSQLEEARGRARVARSLGYSSMALSSAYLTGSIITSVRFARQPTFGRMAAVGLWHVGGTALLAGPAVALNQAGNVLARSAFVGTGGAWHYRLLPLMIAQGVVLTVRVTNGQLRSGAAGSKTQVRPEVMAGLLIAGSTATTLSLLVPQVNTLSLSYDAEVRADGMGRRLSLAPYVAPSGDGATLGLSGSF